MRIGGCSCCLAWERGKQLDGGQYYKPKIYKWGNVTVRFRCGP